MADAPVIPNGNGLGPTAPWPAKLLDHAMNLTRSIGVTNMLLLAIAATVMYFGYQAGPDAASYLRAERDGVTAQTEIHRQIDDSLRRVADNESLTAHNTQMILENQKQLTCICTSLKELVDLQRASQEDHRKMMRKLGLLPDDRSSRIEPSGGPRG